jgi:hypothetical protein
MGLDETLKELASELDLDLDRYIKQRLVNRLINTLCGNDFEKNKIKLDNLYDICHKIVKKL